MTAKQDQNSKGMYNAMVKGAIVLACIFTIIAVSYAQYITKNSDKATYSYLKEISYMAEREISSKFEDNLETLRVMSTILSVSDINEEFLAESLSTSNKKTEFDHLFYVDKDGATYGKHLLGKSVEDRVYFQRGMNGIEGVYIVENGRVTGTQSIVYAVPVHENGVAKGLVCGTQEYTTYQGMLDNEFFNNQGFSNIVNEKGDIVIKAVSKNYDKGINNIIEDAHFEQDGQRNKLKDDLKEGLNGIMEYETAKGRKMAAYTPMDINGWTIMSVVPSKVAREQTINNLIISLIVSALVVIATIAFFLSTSFKQIKSKKEIETLAYVDELTKGLNFNKFKELAAERLQKSNELRYSIFRLDINNFKIINDMYGFAEGDTVLKNIHKALGLMLDEKSIYARVQNDEFIIMTEYVNDNDLEKIDSDFKSMFLKLHNESGFHYVLSFTVGLCTVEPGEKDIVQAIEKASMAHRKGKSAGGGKFQIYGEAIREDAIKEKNIENKMQRAMANKEFVIHYQPKNKLSDGQIVGAEALVRWKNADGSITPPNDFIPTFEKNGFIVKIDLYVLEETCKLLRGWISMGIKPVTISVNQSKLLVSRKDYVEKITAIVKRYEIPPELIEVELTETIIHENLERLNEITEKLKARGFRISIDDFGSGYSSLNMLKDIEVDVLKIDRGFLCMAETAKRGEIVLSNIIIMAKELNMSVVTEGVETEKQASLLRYLNCDIAQGFLYSKPIPASEFEKMLKRG